MHNKYLHYNYVSLNMSMNEDEIVQVLQNMYNFYNSTHAQNIIWPSQPTMNKGTRFYKPRHQCHTNEKLVKLPIAIMKLISFSNAPFK